VERARQRGGVETECEREGREKERGVERGIVRGREVERDT
jgi:hypothetical protein